MDGHPEKDFREMLKDIVCHKDALEDQFADATKAAVTKEDRAKLANVVAKFDRVLASLKIDVDHRIASGDVPSVDRPERPQSNASSTNDRFAEAPLHPPKYPSTVNNQYPVSTNLDEVARRQQVAPQTRGRTHNDYPTNQCVFIPSASLQTTQKDLFDLFEKFGKVLNVSLFPPKTPGARFRSGCVVFESAAVARRAIGAEFPLNGVTITGAEFRSKEDLQRKKEPGGYMHIFQVFLKGIPAEAGHEEVARALGEFGILRVLRLKPGVRPGALHAGIGWAAFQTESDAARVLDRRLIHIGGKQITCERNKRAPADILSEPQVLSTLPKSGPGNLAPAAVIHPERASSSSSSTESWTEFPLAPKPRPVAPASTPAFPPSSPAKLPPALMPMLRPPYMPFPTVQPAQMHMPYLPSSTINPHSVQNPHNPFDPRLQSGAIPFSGFANMRMNPVTPSPISVTPEKPNGPQTGTPNFPSFAANRAVYDKTKCLICQAHPLDCVLLWCGHDDVACGGCGYKLINKPCPKLGCGQIVGKIQMKDD